MKLFREAEAKEAVRHSIEGGQALHVHRDVGDTTRAPATFIVALLEGREIAHLFDRNIDRLLTTARELGVDPVSVDRRGDPLQHVDLVGKPLERAVERCAPVSQGGLFGELTDVFGVYQEDSGKRRKSKGKKKST